MQIFSKKKNRAEQSTKWGRKKPCKGKLITEIEANGKCFNEENEDEKDRRGRKGKKLA